MKNDTTETDLETLLRKTLEKMSAKCLDNEPEREQVLQAILKTLYKYARSKSS